MSSLCCKLYSMGSTPGKSCGGSYVVADVHQATKVCRPTYKKSVLYAKLVINGLAKFNPSSRRCDTHSVF